MAETGRMDGLAPAESPSSPVAPGGGCAARRELVSGLRTQLECGAYNPPVDELVDRLVSLVLAGRWAKR